MGDYHAQYKGYKLIVIKRNGILRIKKIKEQ